MHPDYENIWLKDIKFKTGDIILFKGIEHMNSAFIMSYFTHVGIIYVDENGNPFLFEAAHPDTIWGNDDKKSIFLSNAIDRITKYKGLVFYKELDVELTNTANFKYFIDYALKNMFYKKNLLSETAYEWFCNVPCADNTSCGELVFLSLIYLGLIDEDKWKNRDFHYLRDVQHYEGYKEIKYIRNPSM